MVSLTPGDKVSSQWPTLHRTLARGGGRKVGPSSQESRREKRWVDVLGLGEVGIGLMFQGKRAKPIQGGLMEEKVFTSSDDQLLGIRGRWKNDRAREKNSEEKKK